MNDLSSVEIRLPVWEAFSEFFLDSKLGDNDYQRIAGVLADSPYSIHELEVILQNEVYPVLIGNLRVVAGEWSGFDRDWLKQNIEEQRKTHLKTRFPLFQSKTIREQWKLVSVLVRCEKNEEENNLFY